ncbi:MAG: class I SAM-dependent methyltransferase [Bosea sp.]|uniref:class I SAM-dependent methyltransferase n=1 Tax=Bosea sp. (in: a-proteobacteria) TaxID=1871050 RepID=UPI001D59C29A|nr:class I SAM-dependent methyltransferase [Beijerinckiaceae bacterium]MCP4564135.1 class I SAM-dependent methyltransferase [Bosea sp. (in: a-proteobacteria)]MCP4739911.1 class I SAM-dependent methyltransferase [Bosea sp. (in: a-proteobacteria)]
MTSLRRSHWDDVYTTKPADTVSWFQDDPTPSLDMIARTGLEVGEAIVDIGGGASVLIDRLLDTGHSAVTVLDIAQAGLAVAQQRLGERAGRVSWIAQDVTTWQPPRDAFSIWHDRAVFHFLVEEPDRTAYMRALDRGVRAGGFVILAPFALSGPERCSGLPVRRYSADMLQAELGPGYNLIGQQPQTHVTPAGNRQDFIWCLFKKTHMSAAAQP